MSGLLIDGKLYPVPGVTDREIAEFLAKPQKLGDPAWERAWGALVAEKHAKARMPTLDEITRAFRYIEGEYHLEGAIDAEQWSEGLAFGQRFAPDTEDKQQAKDAIKQLPTGMWLRIAERANYLAREQGETERYLK